MKFTKLVAVALILGSVSAGALSAQSSSGRTPAEFPPSSYKGKQYVDSNGCVFIRAGIDGNVSWIPRMTRARSSVCGFKPTFAGQVTPAPAPVQTAEVVQITNPTPASRPAAPAAQPKPRPVATAAPQPKVVRQVAQRPAPIVEKPAQVAPPVVQARRTAMVGETACPGASPVAQKYLPRGKYAVRCGPQSAPIVGARISSAPAPNPKRAEQSLAGHRAMGMIWTSTVPRRLINQADGRDVTASVPLVYPYTDYAAQQRELGQVTIVQRNGQTLKRIVRNATSVVSPEPRQARVATVQRKATYSSRSAPKATPKPKAAAVAAKGYVQVGRFSSAAEAQRLAQQVQRMGLPVRVGVYNSKGDANRLVIAGPFGGANDVNRAINRLRSAGHSAVAR